MKEPRARVSKMSKVGKTNEFLRLADSRIVDQHLPHLKKPEVNRTSASNDIQLAQAFEDLKRAAKEMMADFDLHLDSDLGIVVVTIREDGGQRVLRQIPSEELLRLAQLLRKGQRQFLDRLL